MASTQANDPDLAQLQPPVSPATSSLEHPDHSCHRLSGDTCLTLFTPSHILELRPQKTLSLPGMFGPTLKPMSENRPKHASSANIVSCSELSRFQHSPHQTPVLTCCTLTSLGHSHCQKFTHTCSRTLTGSLGGQRHTI